MRAVIAKSSTSRRAHSSTRAPVSSSTAMIAESRGPRRAAARRSAASCWRVSASGSPGLGMRTRFTAMRRPACSYISVTAASAWLTVDGLDLAVSMSRFQAVTAPRRRPGRRTRRRGRRRWRPARRRTRRPAACRPGRCGPPACTGRGGGSPRRGPRRRPPRRRRRRRSGTTGAVTGRAVGPACRAARLFHQPGELPGPVIRRRARSAGRSRPARPCSAPWPRSRCTRAPAWRKTTTSLSRRGCHAPSAKRSVQFMPTLTASPWPPDGRRRWRWPRGRSRPRGRARCRAGVVPRAPGRARRRAGNPELGVGLVSRPRPAPCYPLSSAPASMPPEASLSTEIIAGLSG